MWDDVRKSLLNGSILCIFVSPKLQVRYSAFRQQQKWASCIKSREQLSLLTQSANKCRTKVISGAWRTYSRPSPLQTWRWMHDPCLKNIAHEATAGCRAIEYFGLLDCPQKLPKTHQSLPSKNVVAFSLKSNFWFRTHLALFLIACFASWK